MQPESTVREPKAARQLQDRVLLFHRPNCQGVITSDGKSGQSVLRCAKCGSWVGRLDGALLEQLIELILGNPPRPPPLISPLIRMQLIGLEEG